MKDVCVHVENFERLVEKCKELRQWCYIKNKAFVYNPAVNAFKIYSVRDNRFVVIAFVSPNKDPLQASKSPFFSNITVSEFDYLKERYESGEIIL